MNLKKIIASTFFSLSLLHANDPSMPNYQTDYRYSYPDSPFAVPAEDLSKRLEKATATYVIKEDKGPYHHCFKEAILDEVPYECSRSLDGADYAGNRAIVDCNKCVGNITRVYRSGYGIQLVRDIYIPKSQREKKNPGFIRKLPNAILDVTLNQIVGKGIVGPTAKTVNNNVKGVLDATIRPVANWRP